jgi:hypothetical protein
MYLQEFVSVNVKPKSARTGYRLTTSINIELNAC